MGKNTGTSEPISREFGFDPPVAHAVKYRAFTPKKKEQVMGRLFRLWLQHPELRLTQLIGNVFDDPYHVEDFDLIDRLEQRYEELRAERKGQL